jgi:uncharacterized ferritin-like protein (DUF455 family)
MQDFSHVNLQARALEALMSCSPALKAAQVDTLLADWQAGHLVLPEAGALPPRCSIPDDRSGPSSSPTRRAAAQAPARGARGLLHAIAHIEFNAINLALDCVYRFSGLPQITTTAGCRWLPKRPITFPWSRLA